MTICHSHQSRGEPKRHQYRAPEEEEEIAHIHMSLRFVLIVFGLIPVSTYLIAIWVAAHPHITDVDMNPNYTRFVIDTFKFNETGNGEIYVYNDDGTTKNLGQFWNRLYVFNMSHYTFGHGNFSFCYKRNESFEHDWSTSIFRASQLYSSVQTGMRYGLLIMMLPMILTAYIITKTMFMEERTLKAALVGTTYVCNEILFYIACFLLTALHVVFDNKYIPYDTVFFTIALSLSISKFLLRNFTEPFGLTTFFRCIGVLIFISAWAPLKKDIEDYKEHIYCDTFAPPTVCILQLMCIFVLFLNNLYDVYQSKVFHIVVSSTIEDESIQKRPATSFFRRQ